MGIKGGLNNMLNYKNLTIRFLGHDSFLIQGLGKNIYLDPFKLTDPNLPKADMVVTSHEHSDHCHPDSINLISTSSTVLVGPKICQPILQKEIKEKGSVKELNPYDSLEVGKIKIAAIPAYNHHRFRSPGNPFHPKESGHIGVILDIDGTTVYHAGDTDKIPEMETINVDIALLPVSGTYVMDVPECAEAVKVIKADIVIPMHVGRGIGKLEFRQQLQQLLPNIEVKVLEME
jgi:L-ascorbate metabolism protein UlaG (beta-lactamase superfamily)